MKNLTANTISLIRQDGSRAHLPAAPVAPTVIKEPSVFIGCLGSLEIIREPVTRVDFSGIELNPQDQPFVVTREVFDALPADRIEFITPDLESAILNGLRVPHVIRRFIAKAGLNPTQQAPIPSPDNQQL